MNATELRARINADHTRLRELEAQIAQGPLISRRRFDALILKARAEITKLEIQLAGMRDACPACGDVIPPHFFVCRACLREVPFKLYVAFKGALGQAHHQLTPESALAKAKAAIISHLKQHGSGAGLITP